MVLGKLNSYMENNKIEYSLTPHTEINLKWIKDLNVIHTIKNLGENAAEHCDINFSNIFLDPSP